MQNVYHSCGKQGQNTVDRLEEMVKWYFLNNRRCLHLTGAMGLSFSKADQNERLLLVTQQSYEAGGISYQHLTIEGACTVALLFGFGLKRGKAACRDKV